jgi:hypothetical protein
MVEATKPGGLLCVGVPHIPSAITRIPNFLINAPPHHLTWWTRTALTDLAKSARSGGREHRDRAMGGSTLASLLDRALLAVQMSRHPFSWRHESRLQLQ